VLDPLLEHLVHREVVVDQVIPQLVEQEARALGEAHEVGVVALAHRLEEHRRPAVQGEQEVGAHHRVDALEVELVPDQAAARQHQVQVVVVARDLRRRLARQRVLDDLGRAQRQLAEQRGARRRPG
jgi:hypothetical protein